MSEWGWEMMTKSVNMITIFARGESCPWFHRISGNTFQGGRRGKCVKQQWFYALFDPRAAHLTLLQQRKSTKGEHSLFRCVLVSLYESLSVRWSVHPSVRNPFFNARKRVFSTIETARNFGWRREMFGSDEVGKEGCDEGGGDEGGGDNVGDASDGRLSGLVFFW